MDNKVLDEAVAAAWMAITGRDALGPDFARDHECMTQGERDDMRAALLAGVKVLLGEPVATICYDHDEGWWIDWEGRSPESTEGIEVYAPSLGEGDGR